MRALVIDDSKPVRSILRKLLVEMDFEVTEAENGREGLERLRELGTLDLVTVNWNMPVLDGLSFIRTVRAEARYRNLPLLMVSTESAPRKIALAMAAGASDYVVKPFTRQAFAEKLKQLDLGRDSRPAVPPAQASPAAASRIRVLVVDDAAIVRSVVSRVLAEDVEIEVAGTAADGRIALDQLEKTH